MIRTTPFVIENTDFYGWVTATLSILVSILLVWQIYNTLSIEQKMKTYIIDSEIKMKKSVEHYIETKLSEFDIVIDTNIKELEANTMYNQALNAFQGERYPESLYLIFQSLGRKVIIKKNVSVDMLNVIEQIINRIREDKIKITLFGASEIENWIKFLLELKNERAISIITQLRSLI
ncbi:hypothetical protein FACS189411_09910 [Bacteroidia bacterium]|nr:hypothetical protein FACS189411_09910 [Bacteroidia bacterium]